MAKQSNKAPKDFDMLKAIRAEKDYKSNVKRRDVNSRKYIDENISKTIILKKDYDASDIDNIIRYSKQKGIKGITVFPLL